MTATPTAERHHRARPRTEQRHALAALLAAAVALLVAAGGARAATTHEYLSRITSVPAQGPGEEAVPLPGRVSNAEAMTVDAGKVYVAEHVEYGSEGSRLNVFQAAGGAFVSQFPRAVTGKYPYPGIAASETSLYVGQDDAASKQVLAVYDHAQKLLGQWSGANTPNGSFTEDLGSKQTVAELRGVAVDRSTSLSDWAAGDVYVATAAEEGGTFASYDVVDVFKPEAGGKEPPSVAAQLTGTCASPGVCPGEVIPFHHPLAVAVDRSSGDVVVADSEFIDSIQRNPVVDIFRPGVLAGQFEFLGRFTGTPVAPFRDIRGVAVDGASGDIYVADETGAGAGAVDEFSPAGTYLGQLTGTPTKSFERVNSVAVDPETKDVYVGETSGPESDKVSVIDIFGEDVVVPDVRVVPASSVAPAEATLNGEVNPVEAGEASCEFEYGTSKAYGGHAPCTAQVENGGAFVPVQAHIAGLLPDTSYYYRLDAHNGNGHLNTGQGPEDEGVFTTAGAGVDDESVVNVSATSATLQGAVDPNNAPTSYFFQYGTSSEYGSRIPLGAGAALGSGKGDVQVSQHLQGLSPGVLYNYRLVAVSQLSGGAFEVRGPDRTFTTQRAVGFVLPDGRSWEMVSTPDKHDGVIKSIGEATPIQAAADGHAIAYVSKGATESDPRGYTNLMQVFSLRERETGAWGSRDIQTTHTEATGASVGFGEEYRFFSEDLSLAALQPFGRFQPGLSGEATEQTAYLRGDYADGTARSQCTTDCLHPLVSGQNVPSGTVFGGEIKEKCEREAVSCGPRFLGGAPDLKYVVLQSQAALTSQGAKAGLYEWHEGQLRLASILPPGEGEKAVSGELGGSVLPSQRNALSADGSRVVWTYNKGLYLRDMTRSETGETVRLDAGAAATQEGAVFQLAGSDGSRVFFTDEARLTADAGAGALRPDLYECEIVEVAAELACRLTDLTPGKAGEPGQLQGYVTAAGQDGAYVYFVANGVLAPGAQPGECGEKAGASCNLYVRHEATTKLVARLSGEDNKDWGSNATGGGSKQLSWLTARASPDGRWLAFVSERSLTGYDNRDAVSGQSDEEVYLYDAQSGHLSCVSCDPTGARPVGVQMGSSERLVGGFDVWDRSRWLAATVPGWTPYTSSLSLYQSRYLSNSGRLFFNSTDALVSQDVNGQWDVYEYEPPGVGDCTTAGVTYSETSSGCVGAVSSGSSAGESAFLDASETGGDVFFLTNASLAPQDFDTALDVYDAHECSTASPCLTPPASPPPACTTTEACRAAPTPQPAIFGSPSSATFTGHGNTTPATTGATVKPKTLTRAQKLKQALRACRKQHAKHRTACERRARKTYPTRQARRAGTAA